MPARWEASERHVIHIARSEFQLDWKEIEKVFADIFRIAWQGGAALPKYDKIRQECNRRSAKMWTDEIIKDHYTVEDEMARTEARNGISNAARRLNITLNSTNTAGPANVAGPMPVPNTQAQVLPSLNKIISQSIIIGSLTESSQTLILRATVAAPSAEVLQQATARIFARPASGSKPLGVAKPALVNNWQRAETGAPTYTDEMWKRFQDDAKNSPNVYSQDGDKPRVANSAAIRDSEGPHDANAAPIQRSSGAVSSDNSGNPSTPTAEKHTANMVQSLSHRENQQATNHRPPSREVATTTKTKQPIHDGPTFEEYWEHQKRTNPLHPGNRCQKKAEDWEAKDWQTRMETTLTSLVWTPEDCEHATQIIDAEIERRRRLEEGGAEVSQEPQ